MATSMVMPQMGYDMKEGKVVRWFKKEGEDVARGEVIAEIETDKATSSPSFLSKGGPLATRELGLDDEQAQKIIDRMM